MCASVGGNFETFHDDVKLAYVAFPILTGATYNSILKYLNIFRILCK